MTPKKSNKKDTSKLILITLYSSVGILLPVVVILAFLGVSSPLEISITGLFALCTIATGFYYWKAKAENMHKYHRDDGIHMGDNNDN